MSSKPAAPPVEPLERALAALAEAARRELARHPQAHLARRPGDVLELTVNVPLDAAVDGEELERARTALRAEVETLVAHRAAFRPGRVVNLRTGDAEGDDTAPPDARSVFAGYGPSGVPRFRDFGQWLMDLGHPHLDRVYRRPPVLVTAVSRGRELERELLPAFREHAADVRLHGQVAAGWYQVPRRDGSKALLALTFQVVSSARGSRGHRRFGLNVLGAGPDGEGLEEVLDRLGEAPWKPVVDWAGQALTSVEQAQGRRGVRPEDLERRLEGIVGGVARRLEQGRRARERRTGHAEDRHQGGERPTGMAMRDLARAGDGDILRDERRDTLVVLGERGRAHVFSPVGKLVTSIRYSPESIERKKRRRVWRPATAAEARDLRKSAGVG